jgi:hypothetical protein
MVVNLLKYIGPFLRINTLNTNNIENQIFHLSKETLKNIVLNSKCGVIVPISELKMKNIPNTDINILSSFSPLLCIYKKATPKLVDSEKSFCWDEDTFKQEVNVWSNGLMTLGLLELIPYYKSFEGFNAKKYTLSQLYLNLTRKQLEFYASYLRNIEGVFVDKKNVSTTLSNDLEFEEKNKKFKFSDQAIIMAAFLRYSCFDADKYGPEYKNFSFDILNMFMQYRDELYTLPQDELNKICLCLNVFYKYSKSEEAKILLIDLSEFLLDNCIENKDLLSGNNVENICFMFLNHMFLYENTNIYKFKDSTKELYNSLLNLYNPELGIFLKENDKKEINYSCTDIMLYLLCIMHHQKNFEDNAEDNNIILDVYRRQVMDSGIITSWPSSPDLDDVERYRNFSSKSEDLLDEQNFRMATIPTPEANEISPVFSKTVTYNRKKEMFSSGKPSFDSSKNMLIFFLILYLKNNLWEENKE